MSKSPGTGLRTHPGVFTFYLPLGSFVVFALFPFLWMLITSLKPEAELYTKHVQYWPQHPTLRSYAALFATTAFGHNMLNSLVVALATALISLTVATLAAYACSRYRFRGRALVLASSLLIYMFPPVLLLVPLFTIMRGLHLLNTLFALVVAYSTFAVPYSVWLLTGYFNDLPQELEEAAMVDGCSRAGAFARVIFPLAAPGLVATGIYVFIYAWNEFIYAVMFTNEASRTLPVALQTFVGQYLIQWNLLTAGGVITTIPVVVLFMFIQRRLIQGLTAGAVKG
jgi:multiple sugar transport system permease protein